MNNKKEIEAIYKKYIFKKEGVTSRFLLANPINNRDIEFLTEVVNVEEILNFNAPDGYIKLKNYDVLCEHFAVDVSKTTKKGSLIKKESNGDSRNFKLNEYVSDIQTYDDLKEKINDLAHVDNFKNNLKNIYEKHYKKIETYKENIHNSGEPNFSQNYRIVFFIEDTTPYYELLKTLFKDKSITKENLKEAIINSFIRNFKDLNLPLVDYIFYLFEINNENIVFFINKENLTQ